MLVLPTSRYMNLGELTLYLLGAEKGWPIHGPDHLLEHINTFCRLISELRMPATQSELHDLRRFADNLSNDWRQRNLTEREARQLQQIVARVRAVIHEECASQLACVLADDRFGADKLMSDVRYLMSPRVYDVLPEPVRRDLTDAGRCIAFELAPSAAFHLARALESIIDFYAREIRAGGGVNARKFGLDPEDALACLDSAPTELVDDLAKLRERLGNPARQPELTFTLDQARDLFAQLAAIALRMVESIAKGPTPAAQAA